MYEFNITLNQPFKQAMETVKAALMEEKLGVVSEIDVQAVFKKRWIRTFRLIVFWAPVTLCLLTV